MCIFFQGETIRSGMISYMIILRPLLTPGDFAPTMIYHRDFSPTMIWHNLTNRLQVLTAPDNQIPAEAFGAFPDVRVNIIEHIEQ